MAILLLLHEPPEDEPAQQHDVANGFSNRSDGRPVSGCSPIVFVVGAGQPKSLHRLWPTPGPEGVSLFPQCASQGASTASRRRRSPLPRPPLRPRLLPSELLRQAYPGSLRDRPFGSSSARRRLFTTSSASLVVRCRASSSSTLRPSDHNAAGKLRILTCRGCYRAVLEFVLASRPSPHVQRRCRGQAVRAER